MLCSSGFELYSRWVPLRREIKIKQRQCEVQFWYRISADLNLLESCLLTMTSNGNPGLKYFALKSGNFSFTSISWRETLPCALATLPVRSSWKVVFTDTKYWYWYTILVSRTQVKDSLNNCWMRPLSKVKLPSPSTYQKTFLDCVQLMMIMMTPHLCWNYKYCGCS